MITINAYFSTNTTEHSDRKKNHKLYLLILISNILYSKEISLCNICYFEVAFSGSSKILGTSSSNIEALDFFSVFFFAFVVVFFAVFSAACSSP